MALIGLIVKLHYFTADEKKERKAKSRAVLSIETTRLEKQDFEVSKGYIGTLFPSQEFNVNTKVGGLVVQMNYDIGDKVKNNSVIAQIDDTQNKLELALQKGKLKIEESKVSQKKMSIALAKKEYDRMVALRAKKVISESALEKAKYNYEREQLTYEVDKANLESQKTVVAMSELKLSHTFQRLVPEPYDNWRSWTGNRNVGG